MNFDPETKVIDLNYFPALELDERSHLIEDQRFRQ